MFSVILSYHMLLPYYAISDLKSNREHVFMLPDYMVHQEWPGEAKTEQPEPTERVANLAPFAYDQVCALYLTVKLQQ